MLARPDSYLPPVDIVRDVDGTYAIYMDVSGMTRDQIKLSRQASASPPRLLPLRASHALPPSAEICRDLPSAACGAQNVVTIIKGTRESDLSDLEIATSVTRHERRTGDFTMTFRIPEQYQRKWHSCTVEDGVMCLRFCKDTDEEET